MKLSNFETSYFVLLHIMSIIMFILLYNVLHIKIKEKSEKSCSWIGLFILSMFVKSCKMQTDMDNYRNTTDNEDDL